MGRATPARGARRGVWWARRLAAALAFTGSLGDARADAGEAAKREVPDYDGRPETPGGDDAATWTARVVLAPAWFVTEVLIRKPAEGVVWLVDKTPLIGGVADEVTQDPDDTLGVTPIGVVELGEQPMLGAYVQAEHLVAPWERLRGLALFGGVDVMRAHLMESMRANDRVVVDVGAHGLRRDDLLTWGTGPHAPTRAEGTYSVLSIEGEARLRIALAPRDLIALEAWTTARRARIGNGDCGDPQIGARGGVPTFRCGDPTALDVVRSGDAERPGGFGATTTLGTGVRFAIDAPAPEGARSVGGSLDLRAEERAVVDGTSAGAWIRWGARPGVAFDLTRHRRVLSFGAQLEGIEPLDGGVEVPIVDLPGSQRLDADLDGDLLAGVRPGRTLGRSLAQIAVDYRWPIWTALDARLQMGVGNAFGPRFAGFEPGALRFAFAGGVEAQVRRDLAVRVLAGFTTDTFDAWSDPATARFLAGVSTPL